MSLSRPYRIAGAVRLRDPEALPVFARLVGDGRLDAVQVYVPGPLTPDDRRRLDAYLALDTRFIVHAPHHRDGVNPVEPTAPYGLTPAEGRARLRDGMGAALESADLLGADRVVIHGGCLVGSTPAGAIDAMASFLDEWTDPRLLLENLPAVSRDLRFYGTSADELRALGDGRIQGYCLDFAHLYVAANHFGWDYTAALAAFDHLPVRYHHLSNSPAGSVLDRHTPLDAPGGGVPFEHAFTWIRAHPENATCLEYKNTAAGLYEGQLGVFDALYRRYARR